MIVLWCHRYFLLLTNLNSFRVFYWLVCDQLVIFISSHKCWFGLCSLIFFREIFQQFFPVWWNCLEGREYLTLQIIFFFSLSLFWCWVFLFFIFLKTVQFPFIYPHCPFLSSPNKRPTVHQRAAWPDRNLKTLSKHVAIVINWKMDLRNS